LTPGRRPPVKAENTTTSRRRAGGFGILNGTRASSSMLPTVPSASSGPPSSAQGVVLAEAAEDLEEAREFYDAREPGVGDYCVRSLMADIDRRLAAIDRHLQTIVAHANGFVEHYRQQLIARVNELAPQLVADSGHRLETEALLYAERSDIAEETTRLRSHLDQFAGLKNLDDEAGKRMDFILQEMNREVTTILSKTSGLNELGVNIGQAAIEIKVEIEKLREQVQNIE